MAWWVVGSGIAEEEREKAEVGQSRGPLFWLRALFLLYLIPAIDKPFDCIFNLPARIYIYVCLPVYIPMKS